MQVETVSPANDRSRRMTGRGLGSLSCFTIGAITLTVGILVILWSIWLSIAWLRFPSYDPRHGGLPTLMSAAAVAAIGVVVGALPSPFCAEGPPQRTVQTRGPQILAERCVHGSIRAWRFMRRTLVTQLWYYPPFVLIVLSAVF
jgi:hypothetical protein